MQRNTEIGPFTKPGELNMRILISGSTGFIGTRLSRLLLQKGHSIIGLGRSDTHPLEERDNFTYLSADTSMSGDWQDAVSEVDTIINLAGINIFRYWTKKAKAQIYDSRILTTRNIVNAIPADKDQVLISTSAVGFYGDRGDEILNENSTQGCCFLSQVCADWENEAFKAEGKNKRVVALRIGPVFDKNEGPLPMMVLSFKFFAGGPLGSGKQWMSWVHIDDLISAAILCLENSDMEGPVNICTPNPVQNREFAKTVGKIMNRPSFFPVPAFAIKLFMGEMGKAMTFSQKAMPEKLIQHGFKFKYPHIQEALEASL